MKRTLILNFIILTVISLTACAADETPTPTVVALPQPVEATSTRAANLRPTATPIPPPSPTASPTPLLLPSLATPTPAAAARPVAEVIVIGLNVRQGPGTAYPVIGQASAGDRFTVVGLNPEGDWLNIVTAADEPAWIAARPEFIRLFGVELADLPFVQPPPLPVDGATEAAAVEPSSPALSGQLIFSTGSGGELYRLNADSSNLRRLTGNVIDPVLSPDGRQVAFTRWDGAELGALFVINLDGSGERAILGDMLQPKSPAWSPDGQSIIVSIQHGGLRDPEEECRVFDFDDGIRLPDNIGEITKTHVGDDGLEVCYILKEDLQWRLRRIDVSSGAFEDLSSDAYSYAPAWDPAQPWRVIYAGDRGLMQFDVTTDRGWPLTTDRRDTVPVFAPHGRTLALTYKQHLHWEVYTLDLASGARQRLTKPPLLADPQYNSTAPAWSPDGSHLAFLTDRRGAWEIWVMQADGSNQRLLFAPQEAGLTLQYQGMHERMLGWRE